MRPNISHCRKRAGMTQKQVAEILKVTQGNVSSWESGRIYPPVPTLIKLSDMFGCTVDDLLICRERATEDLPA